MYGQFLLKDEQITMNILSFGEVLWDVIEGQPYIGGAPLNFAAHSTRCGAKAWVLTGLGQDDLGHKALATLNELGLQTDFVVQLPNHPTGTVAVTLTSGQPTYTIHEGVAYDGVTLAPEQLQRLEATAIDVLYFGTLAQRHPTAAATLQQVLQATQPKEVFYDVNLRQQFYSRALVEQSMQRATILKLNEEEVQVLSKLLTGFEQTPQVFCSTVNERFAVPIVLVTMGGEGCLVYQQGTTHRIPGRPVVVADAVGAGDAFSAAFVTQYFKNADAAEAANIANRLGGYVASRRGAIPSYSEDIQLLLS